MLFVVAVGSLLIGLGQAHVITQLTSPAALAGISGGMGAFILGNVILCKKRVIFEAGHSFKRVLWHLEKNDPKKGFSSEIV
ncbi:MAG: hypothetical protein KBC64_07105, partial [Simkaniaceae bacterium]|nr:hypothetical protein [Simkaniaceae bacterium]